eukprot:244948-Amphidinium_carterae.1
MQCIQSTVTLAVETPGAVNRAACVLALALCKEKYSMEDSRSAYPLAKESTPAKHQQQKCLDAQCGRK